MPNWCDGNIRFRGPCAKIKSLLENELQYVGSRPGTDEVLEYPVVVSVSYGELRVQRAGDAIHERLFSTSFYIKGTRRNFIDGNPDIAAHGEYDEDDESITRIIVLDSFKAAWSIDAAPYVSMAQKYGVDIHIFGWEQGLEFSQEIEIVNGILVKDETTEYADWGWQSPLPHYGG